MSDHTHHLDGLRVLYSFPHRIGAGRICDTAHHQVKGLAEAGARVTVIAASCARTPHPDVTMWLTLALGRARLPARWIGRWRACVWHDRLVAAWMRRHAGEYDVFHGWPLGSLDSLRVASSLGIRSFLERPNTHTAHAYEVARRESERLKIRMPRGHDHEFNRRHLEREEMEYATADHLLCPSECVIRTFSERGFSDDRLIKHRYGFDDERFFPEEREAARHSAKQRGIVALYAGSGEPRKGLHFALEAWRRSDLGRRGRFLICGQMVPSYREAIKPLLGQPGVEMLGPTGMPEQLMRNADILILPSLEEGSALVTYEAIGSGCVPLVSDRTGAMCTHGVDSLVHPAGDVAELASHLRMMDADRALLGRLRASGIARRDALTWSAAGRHLLNVYTDALTHAA